MAMIKGTRTDICILGGVNGEKMIGGDGDDFLLVVSEKTLWSAAKEMIIFWGGIGAGKYKIYKVMIAS